MQGIQFVQADAGVIDRALTGGQRVRGGLLNEAQALLVRGELTIGAAYLIFYYTNLLTRPMERLMEQLEDAQRALVDELRATNDPLADRVR